MPKGLPLGLAPAAVRLCPLSSGPYLEYIGRPAASIHGWEGGQPIRRAQPGSLTAKIQGIYCRRKSFLQNTHLSENKGDSTGLTSGQKAEKAKKSRPTVTNAVTKVAPLSKNRSHELACGSQSYPALAAQRNRCWSKLTRVTHTAERGRLKAPAFLESAHTQIALRWDRREYDR